MPGDRLSPTPRSARAHILLESGLVMSPDPSNIRALMGETHRFLNSSADHLLKVKFVSVLALHPSEKVRLHIVPRTVSTMEEHSLWYDLVNDRLPTREKLQASEGLLRYATHFRYPEIMEAAAYQHELGMVYVLSDSRILIDEGEPDVDLVNRLVQEQLGNIEDNQFYQFISHFYGDITPSG